jgi:hypothetical protein
MELIQVHPHMAWKILLRDNINITYSSSRSIKRSVFLLRRRASASRLHTYVRLSLVENNWKMFEKKLAIFGRFTYHNDISN